jgi:hypothetical protein
MVPLNRFAAADRDTPDAAVCIACRVAATGPDPVQQDRNLKARLTQYGLSRRDHQALYEIQDGACAICRTAMEARGLFIDHDHASSLVRGLLCTRCNSALGLFRDDPERIRRAADYLEWNSVMQVIDEQLRRGELTWSTE